MQQKRSLPPKQRSDPSFETLCFDNNKHMMDEVQNKKFEMKHR